MVGGNGRLVGRVAPYVVAGNESMLSSKATAPRYCWREFASAEASTRQLSPIWPWPCRDMFGPVWPACIQFLKSAPRSEPRGFPAVCILG